MEERKMILYHNCDYRDLPSILKDGILPMSKTGNNRWEDKKRVNNSEVDGFNYFRGIDDTRHMIDLYNIVYKLN
jgi:hypothetical protein